VILAGLVAVAAVLALLLIDVARAYEARARLATAADAAALAAAPLTFHQFGGSRGPREEAGAIAAANGAALLVCRCPIDRSWDRRQVRVTVGRRVDFSLIGSRQLTATAAAEFRPALLVEP
jgi:hypothetical protein